MSDANRTSFSYIEEVTPGVTPTTPTMQQLRSTGSTMAPAKETVTSQEIRADRMVSDAPEVAASSGGDLNIEWSVSTYDDLILAALGAVNFDPDPNIAGATDIALATGSPHLTSSTTDLSVLVDGRHYYIAHAGDPTQSNWYQVSNVTSSSADLSPAPTLAVPAGAAVDIRGMSARNGVNVKTYSIETAFQDVANYFLYQGQRVGDMVLNVNTGEVLNGNFTFAGEAVQLDDATQFADSYTIPTTTPVLNATDNVVRITTGGQSAASCVRNFSMNLTNNLRNINCVGSKFPQNIGLGQQAITGNLATYMGTDLDNLTRMLTHEFFSVGIGFIDTEGNGLHVFMPRVVLNEGSAPIPGVNQDVDEQMAFTALASTDANPYQIAISTFKA